MRIAGCAKSSNSKEDIIMGIPSVFPTGTTIYDPEKCWNGYTLMPIKKVGAVLIDMNGNVVKVWKNLKKL